MTRRTLRWIGAAFSLLAAPLSMALDPGPPPGVLWALEDNGDAIQKDLGFVLPRKWKEFEREGFSSTREDGGSVKTCYLGGDKAIRLCVLLQLRMDIRGLPLSEDTVWSFVQLSGDSEYIGEAKGKATELSSGPFSLGSRTPAGRMRWARYELQDGTADVQGLWWQNIGVWSVVITASGPEARRAEIESHANALLAEMPFPRAPITTELVVTGDQLFAGMPKCDGKRPEGVGKEIVPNMPQVAMMSLLLPAMQLGSANDVLISPVTSPKDYCLIETFNPRKDISLTAIEYRGASTRAWQARYGFALAGGHGGYFQVERLSATEAEGTQLNGVKLDQVFLDFTNNKRASLYAVFDEWPSYETVKNTLIALYKDRKIQPVISATNTARKVEITTNTERIQKAE